MRNSKKSTRLAAASVAAATLTVALVGCSGDLGAQATCEGVVVESGVTNSLSDALLYIAEAKGYFEDEGLDVKLRPFKSAAEMIPYLAAGHLSVGAGAPSAGFYNGIARNIDIQIVADKGQLVTNFDYMPLLVRADLVESGEVTSVADLKGKKLAEPAPGSSTASTASETLQAAGLKYDDVEHVYLGFPDHVAALQNGSIDASFTTEPAASRALASGEAVLLFDSTEVYNQQQLAVLLYSGDFSKKEPAIAQCFMNAYSKAAVDYSAAVAGGNWEGEGSEEIVEIIADAISSNPESVRSTVPSFVNADASLNVESLQKDYAFFVEQGFFTGTSEIDFSTLVNTSFAENVSKADQS